MGEIADGIINGDFDMYTGEYIGPGEGYPTSREECWKAYKRYKRTPAEKKIASIRKEIAIMVNEQGISIEEARKITNKKYGKGWRERGLISNSDNQWTEEELKPFKSKKK